MRVGCAGWSLPRETWPEFREAGSHLERYASRFNAVEINSSFYRPHQPANALNEGLAGNSYEGVCPAPMDQNFRNIHGIAWREQDARKTLARLQNEQDRMQSELRDAKTAEDRKRTLRDQLSRSDRRIEDARLALRDASYQLDRLRSDMRQRDQY